MERACCICPPHGVADVVDLSLYIERHRKAQIREYLQCAGRRTGSQRGALKSFE